MRLPEEDGERLEPSKVKHVAIVNRIATVPVSARPALRMLVRCGEYSTPPVGVFTSLMAQFEPDQWLAAQL